MRNVFLFALGLVVLSACVQTMEPIPVQGQAIRVRVNVGDTVRVLTKDSRRRTFDIAALEADAMSGRNIRVPYADIVFLERVEVQKVRTGAAWAGIAAATMLLLITVDGTYAVPPPQ